MGKRNRRGPTYPETTTVGDGGGRGEGGGGRRRVKQKRASCDSLLIAPALVPKPRASARSCFPGYTSRHQLRKNMHGREREAAAIYPPPSPLLLRLRLFCVVRSSTYTFVLPPCKKKCAFPFSPPPFSVGTPAGISPSSFLHGTQTLGLRKGGGEEGAEDG